MSGSAHPTTSPTFEMNRAITFLALELPPTVHVDIAAKWNAVVAEIDRLCACLAVWEQLRPDIVACATHVREHCDRPYEAADRVARTLAQEVRP